MTQRHCAACGAALGGKFCSNCGAPAAASSGGRRRPEALWAAGGFALLTVLVLAVMLLRRSQIPPGASSEAPAAAADPGTPPDISGLTPRQQFDTLYNVVMRASENGDAARAARFAPMALMAYGQLPDADADARYHAAVLRLHVEGDPKSALLLADTIAAATPRHLFVYMIRGSAGQLAGDDAMIRGAATGFLAAWDAELASGKPEYQDHRVMLDQFRARALGGKTAGKP